MNELQRIARALDQPGASGVSVLATLMSVAGSAYRGPGARMVVLPNDTTVGAISGGCLEKDITAQAAKVRAAGRPLAVAYDLTGDDDAPWGLNMGCNATLDVLLEPCHGVPDYLAAVLAAHERRTAVVVSTYFRGPASAQGSGPAIGDRAVMIGNDSTVAGVLADGALGGRIRVDAQRVMDEERSDLVAYPGDDGERLVLHEFLPRPIRLVVCGEGNDVVPLLRLGDDLGWQVTAVGKDATLPAADDRTAAVVMTHNYARDLALLGQLLPGRAGYVGVLGPRQRTARLLADLGANGRTPNLAQLQRLHAPVGLDVGAETPEEVALAIAAEVRAQMAGRAGGKLRERQGPIHERR